MVIFIVLNGDYGYLDFICFVNDFINIGGAEMENDKVNLNFKVKIQNLEEIKEDIKKIEKLIEEINKNELKVTVVQDEINDLSCYADQKNQD